MAKLLIGVGFVFLILSAFFAYQRYNPQRLSFATTPSSVQVSTDIFPKQVIIPDINLNLPVIPTKINQRKWEATTKGISFLISSPVPGSDGNSILYGHNWPNLLGNITKLKPGQVIYINLSDGSSKKFVIDSTVSVSPQEVAILAPSKTAQITLYTCSGFLDSKRFVVVAKLINS